MSDQEERMIKLIQTGRPASGQEIFPTQGAAQKRFEMACIAATHAAERIRTNIPSMEKNRETTRYERVEIDALVFYAAREMGVEQEKILASTLADTGLDPRHMANLRDYLKIRQYLWALLEDLAA